MQLTDITDRYEVIYADPPWRYNFSASRSRAIERHYPTMSLADICDLPVSGIAADDCVLVLWATVPKLAESLEVMRAWEFEYQTAAVWDKQKIGMGYWFRGRHEIFLVGTRGQPPAPERRIASVVHSPRGSHSRKPDIVREWIELAWPAAKRIELFAREAWPGWDTFGNQVERTLFSDLAAR